MTYIGVILCEKSIAHIPEAWKCFLGPDSGKVVGVLKRKSNIFGFLWENRQFLGFSRRGIDCAHSRSMKTLSWPWFREEIVVLKRKSNVFGFLWENRRFLGFSRWGTDCAHSRTIKTLPWPDSGKGSLFWSENQFIYVNTYPFPESGSRKPFHGSEMQAIDSPPRKT